MNLILSKLAHPGLLAAALQSPYRDFPIMLRAEVLIILFSLLVPKSTNIYKALFNQYNHANQPNQIPLTQEKTEPNSAAHWFSYVLDLLIPLNILFSFYFVLAIYCSIIMAYLFQPPGCNFLTPFFNALTYHTLLLSYTSLLIVTCYNTRKQCLRFLSLFISFLICWDFIIEPALNYVKYTFNN